MNFPYDMEKLRRIAEEREAERRAQAAAELCFLFSFTKTSLKECNIGSLAALPFMETLSKRFAQRLSASGAGFFLSSAKRSGRNTNSKSTAAAEMAIYVPGGFCIQVMT